MVNTRSPQLWKRSVTWTTSSTFFICACMKLKSLFDLKLTPGYPVSLKMVQSKYNSGPILFLLLGILGSFIYPRRMKDPFSWGVSLPFLCRGTHGTGHMAQKHRHTHTHPIHHLFHTALLDLWWGFCSGLSLSLIDATNQAVPFYHLCCSTSRDSLMLCQASGGLQSQSYPCQQCYGFGIHHTE